MLVEKKSFRIPALGLECGTTLNDVRLGYETYGKLNAAGDNAIFVVHFFSGSSHAAGRYRESDVDAGYWDAVIGPGKAIDTDRFFVVATDALANLNAKNPDVITTGPASLNPATGHVYRDHFPIVTIGDFVETQKILCDQLGIKKLHAVAGPSMGSMQAMEWAVRFPDFVERVICVVPTSLEVHPYLLAMLRAWCAPILLDADFRLGQVEKLSGAPLEGLVEALRLVTITALHPGGVAKVYDRTFADPAKSPLQSINNAFKIETTLDAFAQVRAKYSDPHSFLRIARAVQLFSIRERKERLRAKFLYIPASSDLLMLPAYAQEAVSTLRAQGLTAEYFELPGDGGHLDGVYQMDRAAGVIAAFLNS